MRYSIAPQRHFFSHYPQHLSLNAGLLAATTVSPDPVLQIWALKWTLISLVIGAIAFAIAVITDAWIGGQKF